MTVDHGSDRYINNHYSNEIDGRITLALKKHSEQNMDMYGFKWVNYMSTSMNIDKFSASWEDRKVDGRDDSKYGYETVREKNGTMSKYKWGMPEMPSMVTLVYDTKTNKVKSIIFRANYTIAYTMEIQERWQSVSSSSKGQETRSDEKSSTKRERFTFGPVEERIKGSGMEKWIYPDLQVSSGDGIYTFGGRGNFEEDTDHGYTGPNGYETIHESKTFEWTLTVNKN